MPLGKDVRYRWKTTKSGKKIRLAFVDNKVVETKKKGGKAKRVGKHHSHHLSEKHLREKVAKARASR